MAHGIALIAGVGQVSALGIGKDLFAAGLEGGVAPRNPVVGNVQEFNLRDYVDIKTRCLDKVSAMALVSANEVIRDARWQVDDAPDRVGLVLGTLFGNMSLMQAYLGLEKPSPLRFVHSLINAPAGLVSQVLKLRGAHALLSSGASVGLQAIRYGCYLLASGKADKVICGGVDSYGVMQTRSGDAIRTVDGAVPGEGAGFIGLERVADRPDAGYGVVAGSGVASFTGITVEHCCRAMIKAMHHGQCTAKDIDWVITATGADHPHAAVEREALCQLGVARDRWRDILSTVGQTGGAQGGLAAVMACLLMDRQAGVNDRQRVLVNALQAGQFVSVLIASRGKSSQLTR